MTPIDLFAREFDPVDRPAKPSISPNPENSLADEDSLDENGKNN